MFLNEILLDDVSLAQVMMFGTPPVNLMINTIGAARIKSNVNPECGRGRQFKYKRQAVPKRKPINQNLKP